MRYVYSGCCPLATEIKSRHRRSLSVIVKFSLFSEGHRHTRFTCMVEIHAGEVAERPLCIHTAARKKNILALFGGTHGAISPKLFV